MTDDVTAPTSPAIPGPPPSRGRRAGGRVRSRPGLRGDRRVARRSRPAGEGRRRPGPRRASRQPDAAPPDRGGLGIAILEAAMRARGRRDHRGDRPRSAAPPAMPATDVAGSIMIPAGTDPGVQRPRSHGPGGAGFGPRLGRSPAGRRAPGRRGPGGRRRTRPVRRASPHGRRALRPGRADAPHRRARGRHAARGPAHVRRPRGPRRGGRGGRGTAAPSARPRTRPRTPSGPSAAGQGRARRSSRRPATGSRRSTGSMPPRARPGPPSAASGRPPPPSSPPSSA